MRRYINDKHSQDSVLDALENSDTAPLTECGVEFWAARITNRLDNEGYIGYDDGNFYFTPDLDTDYFWKVAGEEDPTEEFEMMKNISHKSEKRLMRFLDGISKENSHDSCAISYMVWFRKPEDWKWMLTTNYRKSTDFLEALQDVDDYAYMFDASCLNRDECQYRVEFAFFKDRVKTPFEFSGFNDDTKLIDRSVEAISEKIKEL